MSGRFPIAIRTCERPFFLDVTLRSLLATDLPQNCDMILFDDCSKEEATKKYLFTNEEMNFNNPLLQLDYNIWRKNVGKLPDVSGCHGIGGKFELIQPESKKGVRGFIFWIIDYMMKRFPNAEAIHVIEADTLFHKDWYMVSSIAYDACKNMVGPHGNYIGLLSGYDRKCSKPDTKYGWMWRSVKRLDNGNIGCGNGIGGVHYLLSRELYNRAKNAFHDRYNPEARAGDTALQGECFMANCNIAVTKPSMIQHIGVQSLAWPSKGWRYTKGFKQPYAWKQQI